MSNSSYFIAIPLFHKDNAMTDTASFPAELTVFMLVKSKPEWLSMPVEERFKQLRLHLEPLLTKHKDSIRMRFFDTEFYSARVTDVWMWDAKTHHAWQLIAEDLRETPFWDGYFDILEILTGIENAYAQNYNERALSA